MDRSLKTLLPKGRGAHPGQWGRKPVENYGWTADWGHSKARDPKEEETWEIRKSSRREPCTETEETCSYTSNTNVFTSWRKKEDESKYIVNTEIHEGAFPSSGLKPDRQPAVTSMTTRPGGSTLAQAIRHSLQKCFLTTHCLKSQWNICARSHGAENQSKSGVEEGAPPSCPHTLLFKHHPQLPPSRAVQVSQTS